MKQEQKFRWHRTLKAEKQKGVAGPLPEGDELVARAENWASCAVGEALRDICKIDLFTEEDPAWKISGLKALERPGVDFWSHVHAGEFEAALKARATIREYAKDNYGYIRAHFGV